MWSGSMQRLFYGGTNMYLGVDLGGTNIKGCHL